MNYADTVAPKVNITTKYWAMANFSRFIRPGDRFLPVDDPDTVVALKPDGRSFVVVHVNPGLYARRLALSLPSLPPTSRYFTSTTVTDATHQAQTLCTDQPLQGRDVIVPPLSITTVEFRLRPDGGGE
jgi:hypothetical protein